MGRQILIIILPLTNDFVPATGKIINAFINDFPPAGEAGGKMVVYRNLCTVFFMGVRLLFIFGIFKLLNPIKNVLERGLVLTRSSCWFPIENVLERGVGS